MPEEILKNETFEVLVAGSPLSDANLNLVQSLRIDMVADGPDYFELGLWHDEESQQDQLALPDPSTFTVGNSVEIKVGYVEDTPVSLFKGEICSIEVVLHDTDAVRYFIGGFDKLHRLTRGRKTEHWLDVTYSDVASAVAGKCSLSGDTEATSGTHKYISMNNQTYLSFLIDLARRVNYEVNVDDAKLQFKKERTSSSSVVTYTYGGPTPPFLKRARFSMQTAGQVTKVRVFSYDDQQKKQIIGESSALTRTALGSNDGPALVKKAFGEAEYWISAYPAVTQAELDSVAKAIYDEMAYKFVEVEGEVEGDPKVKPGVVITLDNVTDHFSGDYYVTRAIHTFTAKPGPGGGYVTRFFCCSPGVNA